MKQIDIRTIAKRSKLAHSTYKFVRDAWGVPAKDLLDVGRLWAVFRVLPNTMLPIPVLFDAYDAMVQINLERLQGDVVESGVWNGGCVGVMALANVKCPGPRRNFHLFDSFQGLPQPSSQDFDASEEAQRPHSVVQDETPSELIAVGQLRGDSQAEVQRFLVDYLGLNQDELVFHPGWFQDTVPLAANTIEKIALLRLDGDWYESTKICLEGLYDKVVPGGYVIIDDYGAFLGCRRATDEYFGRIGIQPQFIHSNKNCVYFRKRQ